MAAESGPWNLQGRHHVAPRLRMLMDSPLTHGRESRHSPRVDYHVVQDANLCEIGRIWSKRYDSTSPTLPASIISSQNRVREMGRPSTITAGTRLGFPHDKCVESD